MVSAARALLLAAVLAACARELPAARIDGSSASDAPDVPDANDANDANDAIAVDSPGCEAACVAGPHAAGVCTQGRCAYRCEVGFENCDGDLATTGCPLAAGSRCASCESTADACSGAAGYACHQLTGADPSAFRCCRGVVSCGSETCGPSATCVHATDFDLCCAGGP